MNATDRACEHYWELRDAEASGTALTDEQQRFVEQHLASCALCAMENNVLTKLGDLDSEDGPAPTLGAAEERKWLDAVLQSPAVKPPLMPERLSFDDQPETRRRWPTVVMAIAAVLIAIVVGRKLLTPVAQPLEPGALFLAAGSTQGGDGSLRAGDVVREADAVATTTGRVAFRFCADAQVFLDGDTRVKVSSANSSLCELTLESGTLAFDIARLPEHGRLVVKTAAGTAEVMGTVFAVAVTPAGTDVRVERGIVLVTPRTGTARRLLAMEAMRMGSAYRTLTPSERDADLERMTWKHPGNQQNAGLLELASEPLGAEVFVDGQRLGPTPLTAYVAVGEHKLEVRTEQGSAVQENVRIVANHPVTRSFVLTGPGAKASPGNNEQATQDQAPNTQTANNQGTKDGADNKHIGRRDQKNDHKRAPKDEMKRPLPPRSDPLPPSTTPLEATSRELLSEARTKRLASDWYGAGAAYEQLLERYPSSSEARAAMVPYAQLLLERLGSPRQALALFEKYLVDPNAPLLEEAAWGRIKALEKLGRRNDEIVRLREFLQMHPASLEAEAARRRLSTLGAQ